MSRIIKVATVAMFAATTFLVAVGASLAGDFAGTWNVTDTSGKEFQIVLSADGGASADRSGHDMTGTWKASNGAAIITWNSGWTTKIEKDGDGYKKSAFGKNVSLDGKPTNTSPASKAK